MRVPGMAAPKTLHRKTEMNLGHVPLFAALRAKMEWLSERQKILAENIANADTPGYRARDMKKVNFREMLKNQGARGMAMTHPGHINGSSEAQRFKFKTEEDGSYETNPSGNAVSIEEQMMKIGETQMEYEATTGIYRKQAQLLKLALGRRE